MRERRAPGIGIAAIALVALASFAPMDAPALTREFRVSYAEINEEFVSALRDIISPGAKAVPMPQGASIVVSGTEEDMARAEEFLASVDHRPGQVQIEARIVEVSKNDSRELGISWEAGRVEMGREVFGRPGVVDGSFAVNLPISPQSAGTGGTFGFGYVTSRDSLDMRITALEQKGRARLVSSPSIRVMENRRAVISDGEEFLVVKSENSTVINTGEVDPRIKPVPETYSAVLELAVRPRIINSGEVSLSLAVKREVFDFTKDIKGYPPKLLKAAQTDLIVPSGQTIAIGGITVEGKLDSEQGVPFLSRIPILGWLFKGKSRQNTQSELMIFLTPTVVTE